MEEQKGVLIVLFQYSVIVKGMERKLKENGYHVEVITDEFHKIEKYAGNYHLFIIYLPGDILEDLSKRTKLAEACDTILNHGQRVMLLGERKFHAELSRVLPVIDDCWWLDRPADNDTIAATAKTALSGDADGGRKRILIVDDDPSYAAMVKEWLMDHYHVNVVNAGMQAITFLLEDPVDLILLDYEMPVVDGPQVLQMLRQEKRTRDIPVVFLTGVQTKEEVERVMALHPEGYILKSTKKDNLRTYIKHKLM